MKLTFEEDGKGSITTMGTTSEITWSVDGDKLTVFMFYIGVTEEVLENATCVVGGDTLSITVEGETIVFKSVD